MAEIFEEANTEAPLFEIALPHGGRLAPRSFDELVQWLETQRRFWSWLDEAKSEDPPLESALSTVFNQDRGITKLLNAALGATGEQRRTHIESLQSMLADRYLVHQLPVSESPTAHYVSELAKRDKVVAAHALWALMGKEPIGSSKQRRSFQGEALAALYGYKSQDQLESHQAAWTDLSGRISKEHEALRKEAGKISDEFRRMSAEISKLHETQRSTFDELQVNRTTEFKKVSDDHAKAMKNIEDTFKRELSLRSAVDYLNTKADQHRTVSWISGVAAFLVGGAFAGLAAYVGLTVFKDATDLPVPQIAVAVLAATLVFWMLRIMVRVLLSNLHLGTDMRARSTFVHTYLALLAEGGGIKDEDRALVIGLVFRPISDGLVRDDATPPGLWDLVTKNLSGRN